MFRRKKRKDTDLPSGARHTARQSSRNTTVFSYHAYRSTRDESVGRAIGHAFEDERPRRSSKLRDKLTATIAVTLIIVALIGANLRLTPNPRLIVLGDTSNRIFLQSIGVYEAAAQRDLAGSALNGNKATIDASRIEQELHNQFPELAAVSVTIPVFGSQPTLYIVPVVPQLILQDVSGQKYILDSSGRVLASDQAEVTHGVSFHIPIVSDQSGLPIKLGRLALPNSTVTFVAQVAGQLQAAHITATSYSLPAGGTSELDVGIEGEPYVVKFNLHGDPRVEAGDYLATAQYLSQNQKKPLQYIDVRVDGRAYYK